ncbi:ATP-grasp fold amidoligase family protein [Wenzhouxiangella sp. EGI_FJ10305]|uniref:ATP-grasp fold amidoligase family protein n=1 Tax=Wenzhouxiangella sp. EGI_FJ10305 TaxID=3243768 RepID=UPI0035E0B7DB
MISWLKCRLYSLALTLAPALLFRFQHLRMHRRFGSHWYWAQLRRPRTFNEHLLRSKLDGQHAAMTHLVDKAEAKRWVSERIGEQHIIPTLGVYEKPEDVPIQKLPRPCILKPTHTSGHVRILKGVDEEPTPGEIQNELASWQRINHYLISGEPQYRDICPRIICEPLLGAGQDDLPDYKFFCFYGRPTFVQVDLDRRTHHVRRFYNCQWKPLDFTLRYSMAPRETPRPTQFDQMVNIASKLSSGFSFVRVDLYAVDDRIYFGELTFHPESGTAPFSDFQADLELGKSFTQ